MENKRQTHLHYGIKDGFAFLIDEWLKEGSNSHREYNTTEGWVLE